MILENDNLNTFYTVKIGKFILFTGKVLKALSNISFQFLFQSVLWWYIDYLINDFDDKFSTLLNIKRYG